MTDKDKIKQAEYMISILKLLETRVSEIFSVVLAGDPENTHNEAIKFSDDLIEIAEKLKSKIR